MEGIENRNEVNTVLQTLKGDKSDNRRAIPQATETRSLSKELKGLFVKIRIGVV